MSRTRKPVMIGAHQVKQRVPWRRARRDSLAEAAEMVNKAYDEVFVRGRQRAHLVYRPMLNSPRS